MRVGSWASLLTGILAVLAPKCPVCLAAYLSLLGLGTVGAGLSAVAPYLLPAGFLLIMLAVALLLMKPPRPVRRPQ